MINIKIEGLEKLQKDMNTFGGELEKMSKELPDKIIGEAVTIFQNNTAKNFWRGDLRSSFKARWVDKNTVGLTMSPYGYALDRPRENVKITPKLINWAYAKSSNPPKALRTLKSKGAIAHPFIQKSIMQVEGLVDPLSKDYIGKAMRRSF